MRLRSMCLNQGKSGNKLKKLRVTKESILDVIDLLIEAIKNDYLIVYPCDTIYGIIGRAESEVANRRLRTIKNREAGKPFIKLLPVSYYENSLYTSI